MDEQDEVHLAVFKVIAAEMTAQHDQLDATVIEMAPCLDAAAHHSGDPETLRRYSSIAMNLMLNELRGPVTRPEVASAAGVVFILLEYVSQPDSRHVVYALRCGGEALGWARVATIVSEALGQPVAADVLQTLIADDAPPDEAIGAAAALANSRRS